MNKERRHIKYRKLRAAGCSERQIKALMQPGAPVLWHKDSNGQLYPLDGRRETGKHWFTRMLKTSTFEPLGKSHKLAIS